MMMDYPKKQTPSKGTSKEMDFSSSMTSTKKGAKSGLIKESKTKEGPVCYLIMCLLPSITRLHWFHLNAVTYREHEVLGELYPSLQEQTDCLAEQYIEHYGKLPDYEGHEYHDNYTDLLMYVKEKVISTKSDIRGINATIDTIYTVLVKACYKLYLK